MRILAWLVGIVLGILAILFAVSNREEVTIGIWPFSEGVAAPAFVIALVPFALGLLLGALFAGIGTLRAHWRHQGAARKVRRMEQEMAEMRAQARDARDRTPPDPPRPAIGAPPHP